MTSNAFVHGELPLVGGCLGRKNGIFVSCSTPSRKLSDRGSGVMKGRSRGTLRALRARCNGRFFRIRLPTFRGGGIVRMGGDRYMLFAKDFGILSFSIASGGVARIEARRVYLTRCRTTVGRCLLSGGRFTRGCVRGTLRRVSVLSSISVRGCGGREVRCFEGSTGLRRLFVSCSGVLRRHEGLTGSSLLAGRVRTLGGRVRDGVSGNLSRGRIDFCETGLFGLSSAYNNSVVDSSVRGMVVRLRGLVGSSAVGPGIGGTDSSCGPGGGGSSNGARSCSGVLSLAVSFCRLRPASSVSVVGRLATLFCLSLSSGTVGTGVKSG